MMAVTVSTAITAFSGVIYAPAVSKSVDATGSNGQTTLTQMLNVFCAEILSEEIIGATRTICKSAKSAPGDIVTKIQKFLEICFVPLPASKSLSI